jgi:hypothetical protein
LVILVVLLAGALPVVSVSAVSAASAAGAAPAAAAASAGVVRQVARGGTVLPETGSFTPSGTHDVTTAEHPGQGDQANGGPAPYPGQITNRSLSRGAGKGASANSGPKAKSNPKFNIGFPGLNHYQQRYARGGNQFSLEPPDQGLCAGNGFVVEVINDVFNVFNHAGQSVLPDNTATNIVAGFPRNVNHAVDLNSFFGYAPAVDRSTGIRGQFITDPSCLYDSQTGRFFLDALTLETVPTTGAFTGANHLDLAVSNTSDPTGSWTIYRLPVQDDGTDGTPDHGCPLNDDGTGHGPCLGDYPHMGADRNGIYLTTNEYAFFPAFVFMGAQVYAFPKAALASGASTVAVVQFNTAHQGAGGHPGFTLWPAQTPGNQFDGAHGGTEFFLSSDAADEAQCTSGLPCSPGTRTSTDLLVWSLTNSGSLNSSSPAPNLDNTLLTVGQYAVPPKQQQPGAGTPPTVGTPQGFCLNDTATVTVAGTGCWRLLVSREPAHDEVVSQPDSNDTRMQQVMFANGKLWGSLDTALTVDGQNRAGIAWYIINPSSNKLDRQGYLGAAGHDFTYPAIGVTTSGRGIIAFTDTGNTTFPSAAYASLDAKIGVGPWNNVPGGDGAATDDGFTGYVAQVGTPSSRWGDYGAAAVDGNSIWIASEYIGGACDYTAWGGPFFAGGTGDNLLGTCGGASHGPGSRTALANWATFISNFMP